MKVKETRIFLVHRICHSRDIALSFFSFSLHCKPMEACEQNIS